jgi:hypothetical protein
MKGLTIPHARTRCLVLLLLYVVDASGCLSPTLVPPEMILKTTNFPLPAIRLRRLWALFQQHCVCVLPVMPESCVCLVCTLCICLIRVTIHCDPLGW